MPELPEVETTRRGIEPWVINQTITGLVIRNPALRWPVELPQSLIGSTVSALNRRGKYLLFTSDQGTLIVHLGMSGSLRLVDEDSEAELLPHDHVDILVGAKVLRFNDPRRFGCILFQPGDSPYIHPLLKHLGIEPLENEFNGEYLFAAARKRKVAVKNFIMDGKVVVGVGNIYAAESLFMAGIRPATAAGKVSRRGYDNLAQSIREVLQKAVQQGGTTLRDFVGSDGKPGYFAQHLYVYGRQDQPCLVCPGSLKLQNLGQRSTVYCPSCQTYAKHESVSERRARFAISRMSD